MQRPPEPGRDAPASATRLVELTQAVLRGYEVPVPEQVHAIRLLASTVNGFVALEQSGALAHRPPSAASSWGRIIESLDRMLRSWSPSPQEAS
jgi:hypothetical protein